MAERKLTLLYKTKKTSKGQYWKCACACGSQTEVRIDHIKSGRIRSCGCILRGKSSVHFNGYEEISGTFWRKLINNAKQRNIPVEIGIKDVYELFLSQNKKCAISGIDLNISHGYNSATEKKGNASLDRINSSLGYISGNTWWVDKNINKMKMKMKLEKFLYYCKCITGPVVDIPSSSTKIFKKNRGWSGIGNISGYYIGRLKKGAKIRNLDFSISDEFLWKMFLKQDGKCSLTGLPIYFCNRKNIKDQTASLDRINNLLGYVEGNIQWIHKELQFIKSCFSMDELRRWCKLIVLHNGLDNFQSKIWGLTFPVFQSNTCEIHHIKCLSGGFCSEHLHYEKWNRFFLIRGKMKIIVYHPEGETATIIKDGQSIDVPPGIYHKFEAIDDCTVNEIYWSENGNLIPNDISRRTLGGINTE